jgi:hypothetical protein
MADYRKLPITRPNIVTSAPKLWIVSNLMKRIIELFQVLIALGYFPSLFGENGNGSQIIFGFRLKLEGGH